MDTILILLFAALFFLIYLVYKQSDNKNIKSSGLKKEEIIQQYEEELNTLLNKYKYDNEIKIK